MSAAVPAAGGSRRQRTPLLRKLAAISLIGLAAGCVTVWSTGYRSFEASAASTLMNSTDAGSLASGDAFRVERASSVGRWFVITPECTTLILMVPLVLFAAWSLLQRRLRPAMTLAGLAAGLTVLLTMGTVRLATIGAAWRSWGDGSLWVTHTLVGTLISLGATLAALGLQASVTGMRSPAAARSFGER